MPRPRIMTNPYAPLIRLVNTPEWRALPATIRDGGLERLLAGAPSTVVTRRIPAISTAPGKTVFPRAVGGGKRRGRARKASRTNQLPASA